MKGLFDLIANYWIWILLVLAIIGFGYIGYYAEKKGYLSKEKKDNSNDKLVDIDELSMNKANKVEPVEKKEEDLSNSFDEMPEIDNQPETNKKEEVSEEIPEELFAPFGDEEPVSEKADVSEVVENDYNQEFVNLDSIVENAKDINNTENKKDVSELMKGEEKIDLSFDVEGSSDSTNTKNIFADKKNKNKEEKKEEVIDDMWKF